MTLKKVTVCALTENKGEVELVKSWIEKWKPKFRHFKQGGCGCCITTYDVLVPSSAVSELPENLLMLNDWSQPKN